MKLPPPDLPRPSSPSASPPTPAPEPIAVASPADPYAPPLTTLEPRVPEIPEVVEVAESLPALVREAFAFPFRAGGFGNLIIGCGVLLLLSVGSYAPLIGIPLVLGGWAYIGAYYLDNINSTLNGSQEAPPWPDVSNYFDDIIVPGLQMLGIILLSGSLQIIAVVSAGHDSPFGNPFYWLGALFKWLYFPMATLAVVCNGSVWAALPHRVLPALIRCLPGYLVCVGAFAAAEILQVILSALLGMIPVAGFVLSWAVFLYVMLVQARLTGLIYVRYQERMPW